MRPVTAERAKPTLPVWNQPLLHHTLDILRDWGVKRVLINLHHAPESVLSCIGSYSSDVLRIDLSFEPEVAGTGGVLKRADWFLPGRPFWLVNGDILFDVQPQGLQAALRSPKSIASVWLQPHSGPCTVLASRGRVTDFHGGNPHNGGATFAGVQLLKPDILDYLPDEPFSSIIDAYKNAIHAGKQVRSVSPDDAFWSDIGTWRSYKEAHQDIRDRYKRSQPGGPLL